MDSSRPAGEVLPPGMDDDCGNRIEKEWRKALISMDTGVELHAYIQKNIFASNHWYGLGCTMNRIIKALVKKNILEDGFPKKYSEMIQSKQKMHDFYVALENLDYSTAEKKDTFDYVKDAMLNTDALKVTGLPEKESVRDACAQGNLSIIVC